MTRNGSRWTLELFTGLVLLGLLVDPALGQADEIRNLRRSVTVLRGGDEFVAMRVREADQGEDLNGDQDLNDEVLHLYGPAIRNLGVAVSTVFSGGELLYLGVLERANGEVDMNGDGDLDDEIFHVYDAAKGTLTKVLLGGQAIVLVGGVAAAGGVASFCVSEKQDGVDRNSDNDALDHQVIHVYDHSTGVARNLGLAVNSCGDGVSETHAVFRVDEAGQGNTNLNNTQLYPDQDTNDSVLHVYDYRSGVVTNLALATDMPLITTDLVAFRVREVDQGNQNLNGDGDLGDRVAFVYDFQTTPPRNLGLSAKVIRVSGPVVAFIVGESDQGQNDRNDDNDISDDVPAVFDVRQPYNQFTNPVNLRVAVPGNLRVGEHLVAFSVVESAQGNTDLNNDQDTVDPVPHVYDANDPNQGVVNLGTTGSVDAADGDLVVFRTSEFEEGSELNGDGDLDVVPRVFDYSTGITTNLGFGTRSRVFVRGNRVFFLASEMCHGNAMGASTDLNLDGDLVDEVACVYDRRFPLNPGVNPRNLELALPLDTIPLNDAFLLTRTLLSLRIGESTQGGDLNGDGDLGDFVLHVYGDRPCVEGTVGLQSGSASDVLFVNGSSGGESRTVEVEEGELLWATILPPPMSAGDRFVIHANLLFPTLGTSTELPGGIGVTCFPFLLPPPDEANPDAVWNTFGAPAFLGASRYFDGTPIGPLGLAPEIFLLLWDGDLTHLPSETVVCFQGVVQDGGSLSPTNISTTNAVMVRIK